MWRLKGKGKWMCICGSLISKFNRPRKAGNSSLQQTISQNLNSRSNEMIRIAKWTVILFGVFIIIAGMLMLFAPEKARQILRKAGSTNLINYGEITLRMLPAAALILYAESSKTPQFFSLLGWIMLGTSIVLYLVPRRWHHTYSLKCAELIKPLYFQFISPIAFLFGGTLIYSCS